MQTAIAFQKIEGALVFLAGLGIYIGDGAIFAWWAAILIFLAPDLSFAAYTLGPRIGAMCYNAVHVYALGAVLLALGLAGDAPLAVALGALWLAHSGFDRMLGYGLKSSEGFEHTHLGRIGRSRR